MTDEQAAAAMSGVTAAVVAAGRFLGAKAGVEISLSVMYGVPVHEATLLVHDAAGEGLARMPVGFGATPAVAVVALARATYAALGSLCVACAAYSRDGGHGELARMDEACGALAAALRVAAS